MDEKATPEGHAHAHGHAQAEGCFFCHTAMPMLERIWNEETRGHFQKSRVEFLKGLRCLLDDRIEHLSREETKGTKVTVE